jgi:urease beta subunit
VAVGITAIDKGTVPGDGTGDTAYVATGIINTNFTNVKTILDKIAVGYEDQSIQTGAAYELVLTDAGLPVELSHTSGCVITIPADTAVAFPVNTRIDIIQGGAGLLSVTITDDTLYGELVSLGQYKAMQLWKKSATVWIIFGGTT